ncbi:phage tail tape measure protein [Romboutsia sp.]|uniref:phage tail tape measure protein n=1 Tax=Romboutsia sp. TaxID=1965302 RepID=UPI002C38E861|nr:phage tail tape measure protein [Romboutsia sp.]HSQ88101.1 phage tail tape measure protein [Romboutsia sp.]
MEIFKLFGSILIKDEDALKKLDKTDKKAESVGKTFDSIKKKALVVGKAIGVMATATAGGLALITGKALETANEITKFSQVTGHSTKAFQEWDFVMKNFGYSMEQANGDLAALGEKAMDAANGAGEGAELFGMLGLSVTDASGKLKSQEQIFNETIISLQGMEDVTKRNAIASALLSTTGEELVPVLNMTNKELEEMKKKAGIISDEDLKKAAKFNEKWNEIKNKFNVFATDIGIKVIPIVQQAMKGMQFFGDKIGYANGKITDFFEGTKNMKEGVQKVADSLGDDLSKLSPNKIGKGLNDLIKNALGIVNWSELGAKLGRYIQLAINGIGDLTGFILDITNKINWGQIGRALLEATLNMLLGIVDAVTDPGFWIGFIAKNWEQILWLAIGIFLAPAKWIGKIGSKIDDILRGIPILGKLLSWITKPILEFANKLSKFGDDVGKSFVKGFDNALNITGTLNKLKLNWKFTIEYLKTFIDDAKGFIIRVFEKIGSGAAKPFNTLKTTVKNVVDSIKGWFSRLNIKLPKLNFPKIKLPHFKINNWSKNPADWLKAKPSIGVEWYAKGGILTKPTVFGMNGNKAMVGGEAGPEAILPIKELPKLLGLDKKEKESNNKTVNITIQNMNLFDKGDKERNLQEIAFLSQV